MQGTLSDGQIIVEVEDESIVRVILNSVDIKCSNSAPIYIKKASKVLIVVTDNTSNTLTDGSSYDYDNQEDEEPNAAIFSKSDLSFSGAGKLTVNANFNDGIAGKDGLIIANGNFIINAADDGIRGKDYLVIQKGSFNITSAGDGFKSDNDEDEEKGFIEIINGAYNINAKGDAIAAQTDLLISYGEFNLTTTGATGNYSTISTKGLKAGVNMIIDDGDFTLNTSDDALHCDQTITINGGSYSLASGDDGIHSNYDLIINSGNIEITESYEGIESYSGDMFINGGNINIAASDDGLNIAGGGDKMGGGHGWGGNTSSSNNTMYIKGGVISLNSQADGIDANGSVEMQDGTVIINGPTSNSNGALDYDNDFKISGGFLIAVGSSGMAQAPASTSTQYSVKLSFRSTKQAGNLIHVQSESGNNIFSFKPAKRFQSVIFSSPKLEKKSTYDFYTGGTASGESSYGLYLAQQYSGGSKSTSFTISNITTSIQVN